MKRKTRLYLITAVTIAGLAGAVAWLECSTEPEFGTPSLKEATLGLKLPQNAQLLHSSKYRAPLNWGHIAVIRYGSPDVQPLVSQLKEMGLEVSRTSKLGMKNDIYPREYSWWDPDSCRTFIAAAAPHNTSTRAYVLISLDDPNQPIVYMFWDVAT